MFYFHNCWFYGTSKMGLHAILFLSDRYYVSWWDRFVLWTLLSDGDVARHRCLVFPSPEWLHRWRWYRFYWYSVLWLIACHLPNAWYPVLRMWSVGVWKGCSPSFHCLSWFVLLNWEKTRIACNFPFKKRTESVGLSVLSVCFFMLSSLSVYRHFSG